MEVGRFGKTVSLALLLVSACRAGDLRAVGYRTPAAPCLYARDLPLLALMGARVVVTRDLLPEPDKTFSTVLEATGLEWIAQFAPQPDQPDAAAVLHRYATRLRGQRRLIGLLVPPELAAEAAAVARELNPERPPAIWTGLPVAAEFLPGLFEPRAVAGSQLNSLEPTPLYRKLAGLWGGSYPAGWAEAAQPHLAEPPESVTPGSVVRLEGSALLHKAAPYEDENWPLALAQTCLCVSGTAARLSFVSPGEVSAQIPQGIEPGERQVILFRAGQASNPLAVRVRQVSAEGPGRDVLEAE